MFFFCIVLISNFEIIKLVTTLVSSFRFESDYIFFRPLLQFYQLNYLFDFSERLAIFVQF